MPNKAPSNLFHQVLQFDFEGLGRRLWTTVLMDVLLASSKHTGGISLGHIGMDHQFFTPHTGGNRLISFPGCLRLNHENRLSQGIRVDLDIDEHDSGF